MNRMLEEMGMTDAFNGEVADFSRIANPSSGNLFISEVLHKTFIDVNENGTRAAAVTKVEMKLTSSPIGERVILDRPFVYAIIDTDTNLPIFIGSVIDLGK